MNEKVMSAIIEIKVPVARTEEIIRLVWEVEKSSTPWSRWAWARAATRRARDRVVAPILERLGYKLERAKTNTGLGQDYEYRGASQAEAAVSGAMTNTLHRFGDADSFRDDYVVFAIASRGQERAGRCSRSCASFCEMALPFRPVNLGDARHGGALRPCKSMNPTVALESGHHAGFQAVIDGFDHITTAAAVFDNRVAAEDFLKAVKEADFGLSVNISTSIDGAEQCCHAAGIAAPQRRIFAGFRG